MENSLHAVFTAASQRLGGTMFCLSRTSAAGGRSGSAAPRIGLWMRGALLAASMAAWLHQQLTATTRGETILEGHGVRGGKAMIATLRHRLIGVSGRLMGAR